VPHAPRLSIATCRRLLEGSGASLSDTEVVRLVDQMYGLAGIAVAQHERARAQVEPSAPLGFSTDQRVLVEERAPVLEFATSTSGSGATRSARAPHLPTKRRGQIPKPNRS
jgi:hypothetical protein